MQFFDYTHLFYPNYTQLNLKETEMNRFKNFSESGSKVITAALNIAGKMGHITVGTEHILLAMLSETDSVGLKILNSMSININELRSELLAFFTGSGNIKQKNHKNASHNRQF